VSGGDITVGEVVIWLVAACSAPIFFCYLGENLNLTMEYDGQYDMMKVLTILKDRILLWNSR